MNYEKNYYDYILYVKSLNRKKLSMSDSTYVYYELHHIDPKSNGGSNDLDNLVLLTPREHFLAHYLLTKFTTGVLRQKMLFAFSYFLGDSPNRLGRYVNSRLYEAIRLKFPQAVSDSWKNETVAQARKQGISKAYAKRRVLREAGALDSYVWIKNEALQEQRPVPVSSVPSWELKGYTLGHLKIADSSKMGRNSGFKWSAESIAKREETRAIRHAARMNDPEYAEAYRKKKSESQLKGSGKKKETWANKEMSDEWKRMKSETTKAGFAKKKAEALARGECVQKKWVHQGAESMRVLATEFDRKLAEGWEPGRGKLR